MCGRATLTAPAEDIAEIFEAKPIVIGPPRYNIAPTQPVVIVRPPRGASSGDARELALVRWGLIPWWAKPDEAKKIGARCVQARAETVRTMPAFRDAFKRHRCLVIFDGFYEWQTLPGKSPKKPERAPHHVRRPDRAPLAIAGVWDSWKDKATDDARVESCAVITTHAAGEVSRIHDRMPLVLPPTEWDAWLGSDDAAAAALLSPAAATLDRRAGHLEIVPVSTWVNDAKHEDARCLEPTGLVEGNLSP